jgi:hypothetical protein
MADVILEERPTSAWTPDLRNKPLYMTVSYTVIADKSSALKTFVSKAETLDCSLHDSKVGQKADVVLRCVPRPYATAKLYNAVEGNTTWSVDGKLSLPASHDFGATGCMIYQTIDLDRSADKCLSLHRVLVQNLYNRTIGVWVVDSSAETLKYSILQPGEIDETTGAIIPSVEEIRIVHYDYDDEDIDSNLYIDSTGQYGYMVGKGHVRVTLDNLSDVSLTAIAVGGGFVIGGVLVGEEAIKKIVQKVPGVDNAMEKMATAIGVGVTDVLSGYVGGWAAAIADGRIPLSEVLDVNKHAEVIQAALPVIVAGGAAATIAQLATQVTNTAWLGTGAGMGIATGLAIIVHGILAISTRWTYVYTHESA